jgi:drug/metabolite transporter (DMT)-like permease
VSSQQGGLAIAGFAALAAACAFGVAAALQHQQAAQAPPSRTPSLRSLAYVARRPLWLAGMGLAVAAYCLQALALAYGPITLVAPIIAADLLFALPLAARWSRRPLRPRDWAGCLLVAAGVAVFLAVAPPSGERPDVPAADWIVAFAAVLIITVLAVLAGRSVSGRARAGLLAAAAGVVFGLTAAVTASFTRSLRAEGMSSLLAHWQPWVLITLGITGLLLSTGAFQSSALATSLPIIDTVEPVSGVVIGAILFDERLASSAAGLAVQAVAGLVAAAGIMMLGPSLAAVQSGSGLPAGSRRGSGPLAAVPPAPARLASARLTAGVPAQAVPASRNGAGHGNGRAAVIAGAGHPPMAAPPRPRAAQAGHSAAAHDGDSPAWSWLAGPAGRADGTHAQQNRGESRRVSGPRQQCDLLEPGCPRTTAEDRADQP